MRKILLAALLLASISADAQSELKLHETSPLMKSKVSRIIKRAEGQSIIETTPEGTYSNRYSRDDNYWSPSGDLTFMSWDNNRIGEVVTNGNEVYFHRPWNHVKIFSWLKGTINGDKVNITLPQPVYEETDSLGEKVVLYATKMVYDENEGLAVDSISQVYTLNYGADGSFYNNQDSIKIALCDADGGWYGVAEDSWHFTKINKDTLTEEETGADFEPYVLEYMNRLKVTRVSIRGAKDGNKLYLSQLVPSLPKAVITGDVSDDKVTFASGQYLGPDLEANRHWFFNAADYGECRVYDRESQDSVDKKDYYEIPSLVFNYNASKDTLINNEGYFVINNHTDQMYKTYRYEMPYIYKYSTPEGKLQNPSFTKHTAYNEDDGYAEFRVNLFDTTDEDGYLYNSYLYYNIYIDGTPLALPDGTTDIPYSYDDDYDINVSGNRHTIDYYKSDAKKLAAQLIYRDGNGKEMKSDLVEYDIASGEETVATGITNIKANVKNSSDAVYNIAGQKVNDSYKGIVISNGRKYIRK